MDGNKQGKKYFEIFSANEIAVLSEIKTEALNENIQNLTKIINNGMHAKGGWCDKIATEIDKIDDESIKSVKDKVKASAKKYIEAANKLQKLPGGSYESFYFKSLDKSILQHVNAYKHFWSLVHCGVFYSYLAKISKYSPEEFSNGNGKAYIFALLNLKQQDVSHHLSVDQVKGLHLQIDKVANLIRAKSNIDNNFSLSEPEEKLSYKFTNHIKNKIFHLNHLKALFESDEVYRQYIHIRPGILIQYALSINYIINQFDRVHPKSSDKLIKESREILLAKKLQVQRCLVFQELLFLKYNKDDFIEVLQSIVENSSVGFLPVKQLFQFDRVARFKLVDFDEDKSIGLTKFSDWRQEYFKKNNIDLHLSADSKLEINKFKLHQKKGIIKVKFLKVVRGLDCFFY